MMSILHVERLQGGETVSATISIPALAVPSSCLKMGKKPAKNGAKGKAPADFTKVRTKVGKKKQLASNATDTTFKARVVHMPTQAVGHERTAETTDRGLSIKDLLSQSRHYSPTVRKDALQGMRDIFVRNPQSVTVHLAAVVERTVELVCDPEPSVRRGLLALLRTALSSLDERRVRPFFPLLIVHTASAMTHIRDDVRIDSLEFVDLWLERFPSLVAARSSQLLPNFIDLISGPSSGASRSLHTSVRGKMAGTAARESILRRMLVFLEALFAQSAPAESDLTWAPSPQTASASLSNIVPLTTTWGDARSSGWLFRGGASLGVDSHADTAHFGSSQPSASSGSGGGLLREGERFSPESLARSQPLSAFVRLLTPVLLECWVEAGPAEVPSGGGNVACLELVASVADLLWDRLECVLEAEAAEKGARSARGGSLSSAFPDHSKDFQRHLLAHFPMAASGGQQERARTIAATNAKVCAIMSRFALGSTGAWVPRVRDHLHALLQSVVDGRSGVTLVSSATLRCLLGAVDRLLAATDDPTAASAIWSTLVAVCDRSAPSSAARRALVHSLARQLLPAACPPPSGQHTHAVVDTDSPRGQFVALLPKMLWQLGSTCPDASHTVLGFLAQVFRAGSQSANGHAWAVLAEGVAPALAPIFAVVVAGRKGAPSQVHFGPFVSLQPRLQGLAADLLFYVNRIPEAVVKGVVRCLCSAAVGADVVAHVLCALQGRLRRLFAEGLLDAQDISMHLSILLSTAVGYSAEDIAAAAGHPDGGLVAGPAAQVALVDPPAVSAAPSPDAQCEVWRRRRSVVRIVADSLASFLHHFSDVLPSVHPAVDMLVARSNGVLPADAAIGLVRLLSVVAVSEICDEADSPDVDADADARLRGRLCVAVLHYCVRLRHLLGAVGFSAGASAAEATTVAIDAGIDACASLLERDDSATAQTLSGIRDACSSGDAAAGTAAAYVLWELVAYSGARGVHAALVRQRPEFALAVRCAVGMEGARDVAGRLRAEACLLIGDLAL